MSEKIIDALSKLETNKDIHWEPDGRPRLDILKALTGIAKLTRAEVDAAAPGYSREDRELKTPAEGAEPVTPKATADKVKIPAQETAKVSLEKAKEDSKSYENVLQAKTEEVDKLRIAYDKAHSEFEKARSELDELRQAEAEIANRETNAQTIRDYLNAQTRRLQARAARKHVLEENNINLATLTKDLQAPIDAARKAKKK